MEQTTEPTTTPTSESDTSTTDNTSNPRISKCTNLTQDEFKKMILMGKKSPRYQLVFSFLTLYILSLIMGAIIVIAKIKKNVKFVKSQ